MGTFNKNAEKHYLRQQAHCLKLLCKTVLILVLMTAIIFSVFMADSFLGEM